MNKNRFSTRTITFIALLTALEIVLSRFLSFNVWNMKIGVNFIPVVLAAILFGPLSAGIVAALGDFLGAVLFPIGPYFPGFTAVAFLNGLLYGWLLSREFRVSRVAMAAAAVQIVCTLLLNTLNISVCYGSPYLPLLVSRLGQAGLVFVFQMLIIPALYKAETMLKKQIKISG